MLEATRPSPCTEPAVLIRPIEPGDSIAELTELLHRAYAPLAELGFQYVACHQTEETTRRRIASGECHVAVAGGFAEVRNDKVIVLADTAELPQDIDRARAERLSPAAHCGAIYANFSGPVKVELDV